MPAWLLPLLIKYGVPVLIAILRKTGFIDAAEALAIKAGVKVAQAVETLETFHNPEDFPAGKNGQKALPPSVQAWQSPKNPKDLSHHL